MLQFPNKTISYKEFCSEKKVTRSTSNCYLLFSIGHSQTFKVGIFTRNTAKCTGFTLLNCKLTEECRLGCESNTRLKEKENHDFVFSIFETLMESFTLGRLPKLMVLQLKSVILSTVSQYNIWNVHL